MLTFDRTQFQERQRSYFKVQIENGHAWVLREYLNSFNSKKIRKLGERRTLSKSEDYRSQFVAAYHRQLWQG